MKSSQEQTVPVIETPQPIILSSLQGLPPLSGTSQNTQSNPLAKLDGEDLLLPTPSAKPGTLNEKFNHALDELLKDEDSDTTPAAFSPEHGHGSAPLKWPAPDTNKKYNPLRSIDSLPHSKNTPIDLWNEKSNEDNSRNVSVEIPDYSPDFNSESDMIGKNKKDEDRGASARYF